MYTLEAALGWLCGASLLEVTEEEKKPRSRLFATPLKPSGATGVAYRTPPLLGLGLGLGFGLGLGIGIGLGLGLGLTLALPSTSACSLRRQKRPPG